MPGVSVLLLFTASTKASQDVLTKRMSFYFGAELPACAVAGTLDTGSGFELQANGLTYGWNCDGVVDVNYASGRRGLDRGGGLGMNHFDRENTCSGQVNWEIQVPSGQYNVLVDFAESSGKTPFSERSDSYDGCEVEGRKVCAIPGQRCVFEGMVNITDGRFTVTGYAHDSKKCHSISRVIIHPYHDMHLENECAGYCLSEYGSWQAACGDPGCQNCEGCLDSCRPHAETSTVAVAKGTGISLLFLAIQCSLLLLSHPFNLN